MAIGLISNNTELDYKEKVQHLATCADSNQVISARKTTPILING